jgi:hypothetical protein
MRVMREQPISRHPPEVAAHGVAEACVKRLDFAHDQQADVALLNVM